MRAVRGAVVVVAWLGLLGAATACDPQFTVNWTRPVFSDVSVSPSVVTAGSTFTVTATISHEKGITAAGAIVFQPPRSSGLAPREAETASCAEVQLVPHQVVAQVELTCTVADFALNGTWSVQVSALVDGECPSAPESSGSCWFWASGVAFAVTGGSPDVEPPVLEAVTFDPAPPVVGQPFTVVARVSDDHFSPTSGFFGLRYHSYENEELVFGGRADCTQLPTIELSPTLREFTLSCFDDPSIPAGTYEASMWTNDINGNQMDAEFDLEFVAAP